MATELKERLEAALDVVEDFEIRLVGGSKITNATKLKLVAGEPVMLLDYDDFK